MTTALPVVVKVGFSVLKREIFVMSDIMPFLVHHADHFQHSTTIQSTIFVCVSAAFKFMDV